MDIDWTTFLLQIVNFLILIWILSRFLYRPVREAVARRRAALAEHADRAAAAAREAEALGLEYRQRVADWEREREESRAALRLELEAERAARRSELEAELAADREKNRVLAARAQLDRERLLEKAALEQGSRFAARLLARFAGPELEARLIDALLEDLRELSLSQRDALAEACRGNGAKVQLGSAFSIEPERRDELLAALREVSGCELTCEMRRDPELGAGVRVEIGPWALAANLRDELAAFAESGHAAA